MKRGNYFFVFALLAVAQMVLYNYFTFTPYLVLSILPVMALTIPIRIKPVWAMGIAFVTGLAVDLLSEGLLGLNALALVPVAFARNGILSLVFGEDLFSRNEDFSVHKNGFGKVLLAIILAQALFLIVYIWADGAGVRSGWFNTARFFASMALDVIVSLFVINVLAPDNR